MAMLADIQRTVYPKEVTRQLHIMAQARESSPVIDRSNHCYTDINVVLCVWLDQVCLLVCLHDCVKADDVQSLLQAAMPATQMLPVATKSALLMSPMLPVSPQSSASSPTYVLLSSVLSCFMFIFCSPPSEKNCQCCPLQNLDLSFCIVRIMSVEFYLLVSFIIIAKRH